MYNTPVGGVAAFGQPHVAQVFGLNSPNVSLQEDSFITGGAPSFCPYRNLSAFMRQLDVFAPPSSPHHQHRFQIAHMDISDTQDATNDRKAQASQLGTRKAIE